MTERNEKEKKKFGQFFDTEKNFENANSCFEVENEKFVFVFCGLI